MRGTSFSPLSLTAGKAVLLALFITACGEQDPAFKEEKLKTASGDATQPDATSAQTDAAKSQDSIGTTKEATDKLASSDSSSSSSTSNTPGTEIFEEYDKPTDGRCTCDEKPPLIPPTGTVLCANQKSVPLKAGQSAVLAWINTNYIERLGMAQTSGTKLTSLGTLKRVTGSWVSINYTAPSKIANNADISVLGQAFDQVAECNVRLIADDEIGTDDDGNTDGIKGNVYPLAKNTQKLPDFSKMTPVDQVIVPNIDVPNRSWSTGFPGVRDLYEWFGIQFRGHIYVNEDSQCKFRLTSDDGAILYIDGAKVIDNDGVHAVSSKEGNKFLTTGAHEFRVDYFQGPRYYIALQAFWKCNSATAFTIIPPEAFREPLH